MRKFIQTLVFIFGGKEGLNFKAGSLINVLGIKTNKKYRFIKRSRSIIVIKSRVFILENLKIEKRKQKFILNVFQSVVAQTDSMHAYMFKTKIKRNQIYTQFA